MAKTNINILLATTAVWALAACGGSSTGGSGSSFEQLSTRGLDLISQYDNASATAPSSMPTGSATYRGVAAYSSSTSDPNQIIQTARTVSEIELAADFDSSTINGRAHNFKVSDPALPGITMGGEIQISNGEINGNQLTANASGTLTERFQNVAIPVSYGGTLTGSFVGDSAEAIVGSGTAVGTADMRPFGGPENFSQTVNIIWGAER